MSIKSYELLTSISAQSQWITKKNYLASPSEELLDKAISYVADEDYKALDKLIKTGYVFWLKDGMKVYLVKNKWTKVKIRPAGSTVEVWTLIEAIGH